MAVELEQRSNIRFEITQHVPVPAEFLTVAKEAATLVWQKYTRQTPTTIRFVFGKKFYSEGKEGQQIDFASFYDIGSDTTYLRLDRIRANCEGNLLNELSSMAKTVGHEIRHKVQVHRGFKLPLRGNLTQEEYENNPYEMEARAEGYRLLEEMYPFLQKLASNRIQRPGLPGMGIIIQRRSQQLSLANR